MYVTKPYDIYKLRCHVCVTKPHVFKSFGATYVTKPCDMCKAMDVTKPCKFIRPWMSSNLINLQTSAEWMSPNPVKFICFGTMDITKPYEFTRPWMSPNPMKFTCFGAMCVTTHY